MQNLWSRFIAPTVVATALVLSTGCSDATTPEPIPITGNYEGYYPSYVSMILREANGEITGTAAIPATGTANVSGTRNGSSITLNFTSNRTSPPATTPGATFQGTITANGLTGTLTSASGVSNSFTLTRADTVAEGFGRFGVTGAFAAADSGIATIVKRTTDIAMTIRRSDGYQIQLILPNRVIAPGTYPIGPFGISEFWGTALFDLSTFQSMSGQLKIDLARPKALAGTFTYLSDQITGATIQIIGSFSAICLTTECFPPN